MRSGSSLARRCGGGSRDAGAPLKHDAAGRRARWGVTLSEAKGASFRSRPLRFAQGDSPSRPSGRGGRLGDAALETLRIGGIRPAVVHREWIGIDLLLAPLQAVQDGL